VMRDGVSKSVPSRIDSTALQLLQHNAKNRDST
jgi:hypothetical protein